MTNRARFARRRRSLPTEQVGRARQATWTTAGEFPRRALLTAGCLLAAVSGCGRTAPPIGSHTTGSAANPSAGQASAIRFSRQTDSAGIRFKHTDGSSGRKYFPEVMGPGCVFTDLTGDGRPDVYLVNGAALPGAAKSPDAGNRFYVNRGDGRFDDRTEAAGLRDGGYGIGASAADYDGDGDTDLFVTQLGKCRLYQNNGKGGFQDVTDEAGAGVTGFAAGSAFADYDLDGDLDLFVTRYVKWTPATSITCKHNDGTHVTSVHCRPVVFPPDTSVLLRNNGSGKFENVTRAAGITTPQRSLGCIWFDADSDGDLDLFVANDMGPNFLYMNDGKGGFTEEGLGRGGALGDSGRPQASMGVFVIDYDADGNMDLACTNFSGEYLALYRNRGQGQFEDVSAQAGLVEVTAPHVGFGFGLPDIDLDSIPDLFLANGNVTEGAERFYPGVQFAQPSVCLRGEAGGRFRPVADPGPDVVKPRVSRGVAFADYDGDLDLDILVSNWRGEPDLLRNDTNGSGKAIRVRLQGKGKNRDGIGAVVRVSAGGRNQMQELCSGVSYCSQSELALTFGVGNSATAESVRVRWPGGVEQDYGPLAAGKEHLLQQQ